MERNRKTISVFSYLGIFLICFTFFICKAKASCNYFQPPKLSELSIGVLLTWSTDFEEDNEWFFIERSLDGVNFNQIGTVEGAGHSSELNDYHYLDIYPDGKRLFYRLKQINSDGSFQLSDVIVSNNLNTPEVKVIRISDTSQEYFIEIELFAQSQKQVEYAIEDNYGEIIKREKVKLEKGTNLLEIDLHGEELGVHQVYLNLGDRNDILTLKNRRD
jgi:hypothetical protein